MSTAVSPSPGFVEEVVLQGHIIDSLLLPKVLDEILTRGGSYVIKDIRIGQRQTDTSYARIEVQAPTSRIAPRHPRRHPRPRRRVRPTPRIAGSLPPTWTAPFRRTSTAPPTIRTQVRLGGDWIEVEDQEMDCGILIDPEGGAARCLPMAAGAQGRPDRRGPAGLARLARRTRQPGKACSSSWPARFPAKSPRA